MGTRLAVSMDLGIQVILMLNPGRRNPGRLGQVEQGPEETGLVNFQGFYDPTVSTTEAYIVLTGLDDETLVGA